MKYPERAVVLAAGLGTRMGVAGRIKPKALNPVWGKPSLGHTLAWLRSWGVRKVLVNCHHRADEVAEYCSKAPVKGLSVDLSFEPWILGTGGALRRAEWFLDDNPFWIINADIALVLDPARLVKSYLKKKPLAVLWMDPERGPRTVSMRGQNITGFRSFVHRGEQTFTFCGLHLTDRRVLDFIPVSGFFNIIESYERAMKKGHQIQGMPVPGSYWADLGTPEGYLKAHQELWSLRGKKGEAVPFMPPRTQTPYRGLTRDGFVSGLETARIESGAAVSNSVLWEGTHLSGSARLSHAIVATPHRLSGPVSGMVLPARDVLSPQEQASLVSLGWKVEQTSAQPLKPRGSDRTYTRCIAGRRRCMVMRYGTDRKENELYAGHTAFLRKLEIRVPRILHASVARRVLVLEDTGSDTLQNKRSGLSNDELKIIYQKTLHQVALLHTRGTMKAKKIKLMPGFTPSLYRWEHDYFIEHYLRGRLKAGSVLCRSVQKELGLVSATLLKEPRVLIHRDLQSSNLGLVKGNVVLFDFQGMRKGPAAYDLASLLYDPYVDLGDRFRDELLEYYLDRTGTGGGLRNTLPWAGIQRLVQAVGAFAKLGARPDTASFSEHLQPALKTLGVLLSRFEALPVLSEFVRK